MSRLLPDTADDHRTLALAVAARTLADCPASALALDLEGRIVAVSAAAEQLLGGGPRPLPGVLLADLLPADASEAIRTAVARAVARHREAATDLPSSVAHALSSARVYPLFAAGDEVVGAAVMLCRRHASLTADVRSAGRLPPDDEKLAEILHQAIVDSASDAIVIADAGGMVRFALPANGEVLGRRPEDVVGAPAMRLVHPDDHDRLTDAVASLRDGRDQAVLVVRGIRPGGSSASPRRSGSPKSASGRAACTRTTASGCSRGCGPDTAAARSTSSSSTASSIVTAGWCGCTTRASSSATREGCQVTTSGSGSTSPSARSSRPGSSSRSGWRRSAGSPAASRTTSTTS